MTMRSFVYFACPNGHRGEEKTSENDQPYSKSWESVSVKGMVHDTTVDERDTPGYRCAECGLPMHVAPKP
jgi:hypothetical protein